MDKKEALIKLENAIDDILLEIADVLTPEDLNENYSYMNDCQLAEMLREIKESESFCKLHKDCFKQGEQGK